MVPPIIIRTFQLIASGIERSGRIPLTIKMNAVASTIQMRLFMKTVMRTYMVRNSKIAIIFNSVLLQVITLCRQPCLRARISVSWLTSSSSMIPSAGSYPYIF